MRLTFGVLVGKVDNTSPTLREYTPTLVYNSVFASSANSSATSVTLSSPRLPATPFPDIPPHVPRDPPKTLADYHVYRRLHVGKYCQVYVGRDKTTEQPVAIKILAKEGRTGEERGFILDEQRIHRELSTDTGNSFLHLLASWHDDLNFYLVTEYCEGGDLAHDLGARPSLKVGIEEARFYASQIVLAVEELHARRIIHRDLKMANTFIRLDGSICIGDFGLSKSFNSDLTAEPSWISFDVDCDSDGGSFQVPTTPRDYTREQVGTPTFMAPEVHAGEKYSYEADTWSLGVTLYRLMISRMPFGADAKNAVEAAASTWFDELTFKPEDEIDPDAEDLLRRLLAKEPQDRPSWDEIKGHNFFAGVKWDRVRNNEVPAPHKPFAVKVPRGLPAISVEGGNPVKVDAYPDFTWTRPFIPPPVPVATRLFTKIASVFRGSKKLPAPLPPQEPRPIVVKLPKSHKTVNCPSPSSPALTTAAISPACSPSPMKAGGVFSPIPAHHMPPQRNLRPAEVAVKVPSKLRAMGNWWKKMFGKTADPASAPKPDKIPRPFQLPTEVKRRSIVFDSSPDNPRDGRDHRPGEMARTKGEMRSNQESRGGLALRVKLFLWRVLGFKPKLRRAGGRIDLTA